MAYPKVDITITNGNLGLQGPSENGISVLVVATPVAPVAGYGVAFLIKSAADAKIAFAQVGNEPVLAAINEGFYAEAPEGTLLYILAMAQTTPMATLGAAVNIEKALMMAGGKARMASVIKFPAGTYVPTIAGGFDNDVDATVVVMQAVANTWQLKNKGFRFFVEGYAFTTVAAAKDYAAATYRHGAIVVGSVNNSTATATLLAMGRAARVTPQRNIGRVKSGSLNIADAIPVKVGAVSADLVPNADQVTLHNKRYISFAKNEIASGYIFTDDNTLVIATDDYNNLRHGRVMDNAQRVTFETYYEELKDDVDVDENGKLLTIIKTALETKVETSIDAKMREQLSKNTNGSAAVTCLVNPDPVQYAALYSRNNIVPNFNIIQSETIYVFIFCRPKGCLKIINIYLGLTATAV
jgi:Protein of unknown function (DUF2586)